MRHHCNKRQSANKERQDMKKLFTLLALLTLLAGGALSSAQDMVDYPSDLSECEFDLTGETINIYHFGDLSGPYAFITQPIVSAISDAVDYWNSHGGVCGAELAQVYEDTGGNLEATQSAYDRFTSEYGDDLDILLLYSSSDGELLREQLAEDEILSVISAGSIESLYGEDGQTPGWLFASNPLYINQFGFFCQFVADSPDIFPDPVIGFVTWPNAFGLAGTEPASAEYCAGLGVEVLPDPQLFLPTDTDILTQVQNAIDEGANILYTNSLASGPALLAGTLADLGMEDDIKLAGVNWVMDTSVGLLGQRVLKSNGLPAVDGMYGSMPFLWWTEVQNPAIQFVTQQFTANQRGPAEQNIAYLLSWGSVDIIIETIIRAVNTVGSLADMTGADAKAIVESMDYAVLGGLIQHHFAEGMRDATHNRIAVMKFANATLTGPATGPEDAMLIPDGAGGHLFVPLVLPLTDFMPVPQLRG
ncbi:MAG: ABC transporter substrate-binding protein [Chloroflexi bacterium]|nr:ABC transporter substrate-binding protein [Chloroflexota bacterium]MXX82577.1 ABC transporter substrate-binding protein [Chloroflexota bacterium]MYA92747.1 ABC transporter substrate-binding protein [Chloroflexota bacterium]MYC55944.1 ABC transporter substrate-binding protein [Chloroflexota bacterium]MYD37957.1 ABC transporter substrate-binding protein [Chloroflexota bacterium]